MVRYDGIKYAERRCEDLLYELSFTESESPLQNEVRTGDECASSVVDQEEWVVKSANGVWWLRSRSLYND